MAQLEQPIDNGNIRLIFRRTAHDTNGELLEIEAVYRPNSLPPPPHFHPKQEETFEVLSGSLRFIINGQERVVAAGEQVVIPPLIVHEACNAVAEETRVILKTRPALQDTAVL